MNGNRSTMAARYALGAVGALAGGALHVVTEILPDHLAGHPRLVLFAALVTVTFFTACLALAGPLRLWRAAAAAAVLALVVAALGTWASLRFDETGAFIETGHPLVALAILSFLPLPFVMAADVERKWNDYPALFAHSWDIVVRYAAAWVFVGLVWGIVLLSDELLKLVGLTVIADLLKIEVVPWLLTGTVLGVALAVVNELSDYVSPFLVLRLLRLLLPVVTIVVLVFLAALPIRGLTGLFGGVSAAATLIAMAAGATLLVTTALDARDDDGARSPGMRAAAQIMALLLPLLGVMAGVAIIQRVAQYGWTPDRLAAATLAALVLAYGLSYAVIVVLRRNWAERIRHANVVLALVVIAVAAAWLTPAFDPQRLATADQIARLRSDRVSARALDLWTIGREWGRAGRAGLDRLAEIDDPVLAERLNALAAAPSRFAFERGTLADRQSDPATRLRNAIPVRPAGAEIPARLFEAMHPWEADRIAHACRRRSPMGNPGCLLLVLELSPSAPGNEVIIATLGPGGILDLVAYVAQGPGAAFERRLPAGPFDSGQMPEGASTLDRLFAGEYTLSPVEARALDVGGRRLFFGP